MSIEAEIVNENRAIQLRPSMSVGQALSVEDIVAQVNLVQQVMHRVMKEGEHFGTVPGCGTKKVLLQPGAQKLTMTFRLCPEYEIQETDLPRGHKEYRVICTLKSMGSGSFVGQGVGCCSSMESKYRWRGGSRKCPECGKETIIKGKAEYGGGWLCFQKKGGCGAKWPDGAEVIESQNIDKVENDNPADTFNTVLKMAKKRAFVDATITATAASDIFTQDLTEPEDEGAAPEPAKRPTASAAPPEEPDDLPFEGLPKGQQKATKQPQKPPTPPVGSSPPSNAGVKTPAKANSAPNQANVATEEQKQRLLQELTADPDSRDRAWSYFVEIGAIMPNENLDNISLTFVPRMASQMRDLGLRIAEFAETGKAEKCVYMVIQGEQTRPTPTKAKVEVPRDPNPDPNSPDAPWRSFPMPWGKEAGVKLADLDKKYLFGLWANYEVEEEYNGKPKSPASIAKDQKLRDMLDEAGEHYGFEKND